MFHIYSFRECLDSIIVYFVEQCAICALNELNLYYFFMGWPCAKAEHTHKVTPHFMTRRFC